MKRSWHFQCRRFKASDDGRPGISFGFRVGYWPCLYAPYTQLALGLVRVELWYGLPGYAKTGGGRD